MSGANPKVDAAFACIIDTVREIWPDFSINQHLLDHPSSEFVIEFYQHFQITIQEEVYRTINYQEKQTKEPKTNNDSVFPLLRFINHYLRKCHPSELDLILTLTDLYEPTSKRTQLRFKVLLNIVLFFKQQALGAQEVIAKRQAMKDMIAENKAEIEKHKEELAKRAEILASQNDKLQKIQEQKDKANLRYRHLEEQRKIDEEHLAELRLKLQEIVNTYKNKHTLVTTLKSNIQHSREQVVTEENFNSLLDLKNNLLKNCTELDIDIGNLTKNLTNRKPMAEHFQTLKRDLQKLIKICQEFKVLQSSVLSNTTQLEIVEGKRSEVCDKLKILHETKTKLKECIKVTKEVLQSEMIKEGTLREKLQSDFQQVQKEIKEEKELQHQSKSDENLLEKECEMLNSRCNEIAAEIQEFNSYMATTYKDMLMSENEVVNKFSNICKHFVYELS